MQQSGPLTPSCSSAPADCLPLCRLPPPQCGSDTEAEVEKCKVRVSVSQRLTAITTSSCKVEYCGGGSALSCTAAVDKLTDPSRMRSTGIFYICYLLCLCLGLACVVCVCVWNSHWRGGFAWDRSHQQFNWHPVLMVTGLVVVYGNGAVLYRIPLTWGQNKLPWKLLHAALMLIALVLSVVGLCAVFEVHNAENIANLYSLHSWIGIAATALFAIQWVVGLAGFLLPCSPTSLRILLKPVHVWMGGSILLLSIAACISGINEKLFFALKGKTNGTQPYSSLPPEALFANSLGVLIVAFGLVVLKILSNHRWQRPDSQTANMAYTPLLQEENE